MSQLENDGLNELFDDYENNGKSDKPKLSKEELFKKFFTPQHENPLETFRVLPPKKGEKYAQVAHFHEVKIGGQFKKIYCPKHNDGQQCDMCDMEEKIKATQKKGNKDTLTDAEMVANKEIWKKSTAFQAKKFYILKGIDQGKQKDGVKFWRIKENHKKAGVYDKFIAAAKLYHKDYGFDFSDVENGTDFRISTATDKTPAGYTYTVITSINAAKPSKLSDDEGKVKQLVDDNLTWRDVFTRAKAPNITPDQYLGLVVKGQAPYYLDKNNEKRWVFPGNPELEAKANSKNNKDLNTSKASETKEEKDELEEIFNKQESPVDITKLDTKATTESVIKDLDNDLDLLSDEDDLPF